MERSTKLTIRKINNKGQSKLFLSIGSRTLIDSRKKLMSSKL
jgi:hypothetical protein